jgi:hypothetical protein
VEKVERVLETLPAALDRSPADPSDGAESPSDALDRLLTRSVMELRFTLNEQTFEYLRWRVERARDAIAQPAGDPSRTETLAPDAPSPE